MTNILLVCQGGMSSSFLVKKIHEAFSKNQEEIQIISKASMEIVDYIDWADIILVSPSVLYAMDEIMEVCQEYGIIPILIPLELYGRMDGDAIRKLIVNS
jgi:PTS system cellobiose-specific IIB component